MGRTSTSALEYRIYSNHTKVSGAEYSLGPLTRNVAATGISPF